MKKNRKTKQNHTKTKTTNKHYEKKTDESTHSTNKTKQIPTKMNTKTNKTNEPDQIKPIDKILYQRKRGIVWSRYY